MVILRTNIKPVGRIRSQRTAGKKLVFFDLVHNGHKVQVLCNQRVVGEAGISPEKFKEFYHLLRRGDSFCKHAIAVQLLRLLQAAPKLTWN